MHGKLQPDMSTRPNKTLEGMATNLNLPIVHEWIPARKPRLGDLCVPDIKELGFQIRNP
jgi:hypothetical protein